MDSKLAGDVGFQSNNACDSLYGQKHDEKYALYKVICYTHTHTHTPPNMLLFSTVLTRKISICYQKGKHLLSPICTFSDSTKIFSSTNTLHFLGHAL